MMVVMMMMMMMMMQDRSGMTHVFFYSRKDSFPFYFWRMISQDTKF